MNYYYNRNYDRYYNKYYVLKIMIVLNYTYSLGIFIIHATYKFIYCHYNFYFVASSQRIE